MEKYEVIPLIAQFSFSLTRESLVLSLVQCFPVFPFSWLLV